MAPNRKLPQEGAGPRHPAYSSGPECLFLASERRRCQLLVPRTPGRAPRGPGSRPGHRSSPAASGSLQAQATSLSCSRFICVSAPLPDCEFPVAGSQGPLRSKPKEQSAWCVLALQGRVSTEPPPWRPAHRSRRCACLRGGEGLPWVPDTCLSDAQDFRCLPPEGPFLLRLLICLVAQGRGVWAGWGSGLREQTAPGSEAPNTGRT